MAFRIFSSTLLKLTELRGVQLLAKERNKYLGLIFSSTSDRKYVTSTGESFDWVHMWKYLDFVVNNNPQNHRLSGDLKEIASFVENRKNLEKDIKSLESMSSDGDKDLEKLIEAEKKQFLESVERLNDDTLSYILSSVEENDDRDVELRLIAGIGGEEARLFSEELFNMYVNYAEFKNWDCLGDVKDGCLSISGKSVFNYLKYEAGVHRVQRVPETEKSGRIHTSTCSVVVLPQPKPHEIVVSEKDLIIEKMRSSGPGGQNVNKRESCIRIKHIPTGIIIESQASRFQFENLKFAIAKLRGILFNQDQEKLKAEEKAMRKEQAGTNDYADKIRTYHYLQNRVTDHRVNHSTQNLKGYLLGKGELDQFIEKVREQSKRKELIYKIRHTLDSVEYKNFEKQQTEEVSLQEEQEKAPTSLA